MIELRTIPHSDDPPDWEDVIEVCGPNTNGVYEALDGFIQKYMLPGKQVDRFAQQEAFLIAHRRVTNPASSVAGLGYRVAGLRKGSNAGARHHCDAHFSVDKFLMNPSQTREDGRWSGYLNGESNLGGPGVIVLSALF